ncbi:MAG: FIST N-terminal domain-containing protein [Actinomycetota bacterium]
MATPDVLIGATAVGVLGGAEEIEQGDALSAWAAAEVAATPLRLEALPGPMVLGLPTTIAEGSTIVLLADPYSFPVDALVDQLNDEHRSVDLVGGLASAPGGPDRNRLVLDDVVHDDGAVALLLAPGVATPVVSQGCRPIGEPWVITEADGQLVHHLGGRPAMERLSAVIEGLSEEERMIAARGLHAGLVANDHQDHFDQGDFLIRGVLGADRSSGAVAIGDQAEVGAVLQFQVRDEDSASRELDRLLSPVQARSALVFTCNGRGSHLFATPNHDAERVQRQVGPAVAGMFCAGELGPIADRNAVHGFTATVLTFP